MSLSDAQCKKLETALHPVLNSLLWFYRCRCYADGDPRAVGNLLGVDTANMSVVRCAELARTAKYTVFAVQYGQECWGSKSIKYCRF